jgi:hypothetical protein
MNVEHTVKFIIYNSKLNISNSMPFSLEYSEDNKNHEVV